MLCMIEYNDAICEQKHSVGEANTRSGAQRDALEETGSIVAEVADESAEKAR
jgi:hypothetical protein